MPDWKKWTEFSKNSLNLDTCLQGCGCAERGITNCDCIEKDKSKWESDFLYVRKFTPPPVRPVNRFGYTVLHPDGYVMGPYLYDEWLASGFEIFDRCHEIINSDRDPDWSTLYFRNEADFYGAIYSHFYPIFLLMIHKMASLEAQHGVSNDLTRGVDLYQTLRAREFTKSNVFRNKGEMYLKPQPHEEFITEIHKQSLEEFDLSVTQNQLLEQSKFFKDRAKMIKKQNKKRSWQQALHFLPKPEQTFENWYPKVKQTPIWFDFKQNKWLYPPIFHTAPEILECQQSLVEKTIENWLKSGAIFIIEPEKVDLCTPLVIANVQLPNRPPPDPTKKPRICHDGGFEKSVELFSFPCKLDDLSVAQKTMEKNDLMSKTDDKRGFHLVKLAKESRGLTAFYYKGKFLAYRVALFGSPIIPAIFQRANMVVVNYCRVVFGIVINLYLDDRLMIDNAETIINGVPMHAFVCTSLIVAAGGVISIQKSDFEPKHIQEFLGLTLNTKNCEISVPGHKWEKFRKIILKILQEKSCTFKELEKLRGLCVSFILCNPMTKLFIRTMNAIIAEATAKELAPSAKIYLDAALRAELEEWLKLDYLQMKHCWKNEINPLEPLFRLSFTDSSSFSASTVIFLTDGTTITKQWFFAEDTQPLPIYYKEGLAILWMLRFFPEKFQDRQITHFCDNQNIVASYNNLGSKVGLLNEIITNIYKELHKLNATLTMFWISTHHQLADESSRHISWNEEYLPKVFFDEIMCGLNVRPDIDVFATSANKKCKEWINLGIINDDNCLGYDFFCVNPKLLKNRIIYAFPPKNIINKVIYHLSKYYKNHKVVLIMHVFEEWPAAFPRLLQIGAKTKKLKSPITVIPAEFQLVIEGHMHYGFWNTKPKQTVAVYWNI